MTGIEELFAEQPVMAILRNLPAEQSVALATKAWDLGIHLVEVTIQTPDAVEALKAVASAARDRGQLVGAGTVVTAAQVDIAAEAGAAFTVAPGFDQGVVDASRSGAIPHLPGVATPTDVQRAVRAGFRTVKAFPAAVLGPAWFRIVRGPFPDIRFVATGGIDATNARSFLESGVQTVAVGSALTDPSQIALLADLIPNSG